MPGHRIKQWAVSLLRRFQAAQCLTLSAALAYHTLLALVPTVALVLVVLGRLPYVLEWIGEIDVWLLPHFLPTGVGSAISDQLFLFSQQAGRATLPSILVMLVTAMLLLESITQTFDRIWNNHTPRPLKTRLLLYICTLFVWPVAIGLALTTLSWALTLSQGVLGDQPALRLLPRLMSFLAPALFISLLYYFVPNVRVRVRHAVLAGALAAACFSLVQYGFLHLARVSFYTSIYGALALIPIFLIWLYCAWIVILCGAFLVARLGGR